MTVLIDADGCPVLEICIRCSADRRIPVVLVCDSAHEFDRGDVRVVTVPRGPDSADWKLLNMVQRGDVVVTQDYGLAAMCLAKGATAIHQNGQVFDDHNIGGYLESRHRSREIRRAGGRIKGPKKRSSEQNKAFEQAFCRLLDCEITI